MDPANNEFERGCNHLPKEAYHIYIYIIPYNIYIYKYVYIFLFLLFVLVSKVAQNHPDRAETSDSSDDLLAAANPIWDDS
jgi:hypothetical protein